MREAREISGCKISSIRDLLPSPRTDAKAGLTGSSEYTQSKAKADKPPAANDFWLPLFT